MSIDSIVEEVRQAREAYAKKFNYDVYAMWRDLKKRQQKNGLQQGVSLSPKRIQPVPLKPPVQGQGSTNEGIKPTP